MEPYQKYTKRESDKGFPFFYISSPPENKIHMNIQQLEYIVALDDHRHFVDAAESCHITQPTLTMQVRKLEDEVGVQIFNRAKKPLEPTPAGEEIIIRA